MDTYLISAAIERLKINRILSADSADALYRYITLKRFEMITVQNLIGVTFTVHDLEKLIDDNHRSVVVSLAVREDRTFIMISHSDQVNLGLSSLHRRGKLPVAVTITRAGRSLCVRIVEL